MTLMPLTLTLNVFLQVNNEAAIVLDGEVPLDHDPQKLVTFGNRSNQLLALKVS